MKILMISAHFDLLHDTIPVGGVQTHISKVSAALRQCGHDVMWSYPGVTAVPGTTALVDIQSGLDWADAVVMHDFCSWQNTAKKNLVVFHGWEGQCPPASAVISRRQAIAQMAGATIAVGQFILKWYQHTADEVIWGAADPPSPGEPTLQVPGRAVYVGRLEPDTGCMEAIKSAVAQGFEVHVYGDGSLHVPLEQWRDSTPGARVVLYGFVPNAAQFFATASLALPSGYLTYLEALIRRRPCAVVATNPLKVDYWGMHPYPPSPVPAWFSAWDWARKQTWSHVADIYENLLGRQ